MCRKTNEKAVTDQRQPPLRMLYVSETILTPDVHPNLR